MLRYEGSEITDGTLLYVVMLGPTPFDDLRVPLDVGARLLLAQQ